LSWNPSTTRKKKNSFAFTVKFWSQNCLVCIDIVPRIFVTTAFYLLLIPETQNRQTSAATSQSGRPSLSFSSTYGFSWTRLRSSWRPSKRKARSSCESCCWNPLNLGAYFAMVHYKYEDNSHYFLHHKIWNVNAP
jgi:hypothetical protein